MLYIGLKIALWVALICTAIFLSLAIICWRFIVWYDRSKEKKLFKTKEKIKAFYDRLKRDNINVVYDETPAWIKIGDRLYECKPIKYWQYCRLNLLFGDVYKKAKEQGITTVMDLLSTCTDEVCEGLALICCDFDTLKAEQEKHYIKANMTQNDIYHIANVIIMQNNISVFIEKIKELEVKKKE